MNNKTSLSNWINIGTLNVRGINENYKIKTLEKYKLDIVGLQETHMKGSGNTTHISINKLTN